MTAINSVVDLSLDGDVAVVTVNSPPVNALSSAVRQGLFDAFGKAAADPAAKAIVLICEGRTFIAGADITEFAAAGLKSVGLQEIEESMENAGKPVVAAIHGTALGGGLEVALAAHYRIGVPSAKVGLPEVNIGLLPGAGGTQRLPRVVGVQRALEMVTSGEHVPAKKALEMGLLDEMAEEGKLREGALAYARKLAAENRPLKRVRDLEDKIAEARANPGIFDEFRKANAKKFKGFNAPENNIRAVEAAVKLPFDEGMVEERRLFTELKDGPQAPAQQYYFFAERAAQKIADVPADTPLRPIKKVGVIGAGTMGGGIAMSFANAGIPVTLVEVQQEALDRGLGVIRKNYERTASRGGITPAQLEERTKAIVGSLNIEDLKDVDLVIEAVFENMDVKKEIFRKLDAICKPGAILATNTSRLDVNEIAEATKRPQDVIGMHYFSPANVMKLLEVVRGAKTAKDVIATAMKIGKQTGKIPVLVGVCWGFVGNRIIAQRANEGQELAFEGASPADVDRAFNDFGVAMGPFQMTDLAGLQISWVAPGGNGEKLRDKMVAKGRLGQKTGAGYYDYDENRNATLSPLTLEILEENRAAKGVKAREIGQQEILERCLYLMINEGAKILEEGVAEKASDIDVIYVNGYGWPVYRGGLMYYADKVGLPKIVEALKGYEARLGPRFKPAALLEKLAAEGKTFTGR
jgi:3-hydroxyacyl-CoA dehydrogenase